MSVIVLQITVYSQDYDTFAEKIIFSLEIKNLLDHAGPVLSTYQSFRLPYFTPLLPNNAIILASNLGWLSWVEPTPPTYTAPEQG